MENLEQKINKIIDDELEYADKRGSTKLSTCDHYNWDRDVWNHRHQIIEEIRRRGYSVSVSTNWGVTDINITKILNF